MARSICATAASICAAETVSSKSRLSATRTSRGPKCMVSTWLIPTTPGAAAAIASIPRAHFGENRLAGQEALALIGEKPRRHHQYEGDAERGDAVEDRQVQHIRQADADHRHDQPDEGRGVFQEDREDRRVLAAARRGEPARGDLLLAEFAKGHDPRGDLEQDRQAEHDIVDDDVLDRLGLDQLVHPLDRRHHRAEPEDQHRDDEHPEIELQPMAERMRGIGRPGGAAQPVQQQQLVAAVDRGMHRLAEHRRAAGDRRGDRFAQGDRDIAGERRDDDPER